MELGHIQARLRPHAPALGPGLIAVSLMLVWAVHDGGYDADTWYWGALFLLATLAAVVVGLGRRPAGLSRSTLAALIVFALYVAWSYLSISWAQSPGDALQGSNRALLYLLVFALFVVLPWTPGALLTALLTFVLAVGGIAIVMLIRLASADHVAQLVVGGRLLAPTGYFNSSVALFTIDALAAIALASRRELPALLRGVLIAIACAGLQLALIGQSRGWLFTLPVVAIAAIAIVGDRLRVAAASVLPIAAVLIPLHRLLGVYKSGHGTALDHAASRAGDVSLALCAGMLVLGTLIAWGETSLGPRSVSRRLRRQLGAVVTGIAVAAGCAGALAATHGHPIPFIKRQWHGFVRSSPPSKSGSYFGVVGSGRYDFWRVSMHALAAHPIGGLGQDNFADYYIKHGRTGEEPQWTHSLEMRLLAHTGLVGAALFATFLIAALAAALRTVRRADDFSRWVAGAALLPLVVWLIHGSVDWFWEMPALAAPALGFLGAAGVLGVADPVPARVTERRRSLATGLAFALGTLGLLAAVFVLAFPYLSVREVSIASDVRGQDPAAALRDLRTAADLNPLSAVPGRLAGAIALQTRRYTEAERRFSQATAREPGGWFSWLGDGLAASALGDSARAHHDYLVAYSIAPHQPAVHDALTRVNGSRPLTPSEAFAMLVLAH